MTWVQFLILSLSHAEMAENVVECFLGRDGAACDVSEGGKG